MTQLHASVILPYCIVKIEIKMDFLNIDIDNSELDSTLDQGFPDVVKKVVLDLCEEHMTFTINSWNRMGIGVTKRQEVSEDIMQLLTNVFEDISDRHRKHIVELEEYRDEKLKSINGILQDLTLPSYEPSADMPLVPLAKLLHVKFDELRVVKDERLNQLTDLKSKRAKLCLALGIQPKPFSMKTAIPSEPELMSLQSYICELEKEKAKRLNKYKGLRKIIEQLRIDLERDTFDDFEGEVLQCEIDQFVLSEENMKKVQIVHSTLEAECFKNNERRKKLESRLNALWDKLEVPQNDRDHFFLDNSGSKPSTLKTLEVEVEKYEELKRQNLGLFISKIRPEIDQWYEKCCISDEERERFADYVKDENYTEELLEVHEDELNRLKLHYNENQQVYEKLLSWRNFWERLRELEGKMNDPARFNNRGGALLQEEKERKQLHKGLPKLEKELKTMCKTWSENNNGKPFLIYGQDIDAFFEEHWNQYMEAKENEKKARQHQKQMELQANLKGKKIEGGVPVLRKTPNKRPFGNVNYNSPGSANKMRKLNPKPPTPLRSLNEVNKASGSKRPVVTIPTVKSKIRSNLNAKMTQAANPNTAHMEPSILSINEDDFQAPLGERVNANSTFIRQTQVPDTNVTSRRRL